MDYEQAYYKLFNAMSDMIEMLKAAQTEAEEIVLQKDEEETEEEPEEKMEEKQGRVVELFRKDNGKKS
ncbi:MAG: hypothetical protein ACYCX2_02405 [Christensenellales bacterium]